ncbi:glycosyltransferase [Lactococcus lactis subsp. lactis]|uniref:Group 1 glycosyltransferase n=1 Tax=Lactococcus lactis TaxID=1358 RepID=A0AAX0PY04_9LACT|nr:glycosyltransferase [Lactococcus lactis]AZY91780.1 glycosyltransferase [Lactococcus lactis]PAK87723.1 group 1 glycosyltransferase [Lactococcus lactis]RQE34169.1 glycosyltransferase [Lactococcus lactis]RQE34706.1 glycosyltransferase [Lactococcus lactis]RQE42007.1 glycosyltransferase [Lactococcus lactis]
MCDLMLNLDYEIFEVWVAYNDDAIDDIFRQTIEQLSGKITPILINNLVRELNLKEDIKAYLKLSKLIKKVKPDIVHCHSSKAGVLGRIATKRRRVNKIFYTPHAYSFLSTEFSKRKKYLFIRIEKFLSRNATTKTFNVSNSEKYSALKYNIDNDKKLKVIYNGLVSQTKENILNKQDNLRKKLKIKDSSYIIGNMARVESQKNPQLFNNIAHKAYSDRKDIAFIWIGDGSLKNKVQQNSSDNTYFLNFSEKNSNYLSEFDGYISTSDYEGLPYSPLEALQEGIPVLLSDVVGHDEIVEDGVNGKLYNPDNILVNIQELYDFIDWSKTSDKQAIKKSVTDKFSIDNMILEISSEYLV